MQKSVSSCVLTCELKSKKSEEENSCGLKDASWGKSKILKNVFIICLATFLQLTAFDGLSMLQSTMNRKEGIGAVCMAIFNLLFCLSSLLLPKPFIQRWGCKTTFALSVFCYLPFLACNYAPEWYWMVPAAMLAGCGCGLFQGSQSTYLNEMSVSYATLSKPEPKVRSRVSDVTIRVCHVGDPITQNAGSRAHYGSTILNAGLVNTSECNPQTDKVFRSESTSETSTASGDMPRKKAKDGDSILDAAFLKTSSLASRIETTTALFFGVQGFAFMACQVSGNLLSYLVLGVGILSSNQTSFNPSHQCGAHFCAGQETSLEADDPSAVDQESRYILTSICLALVLTTALFICLFLDPLKRDRGHEGAFTFSLLMATFSLGVKKLPLLLTPIGVNLGLWQGFYVAEFTKNFIACSWGASAVGLVSMVFGASCCLTAAVSGWLVKGVGRVAVFSLVTAVHIATAALLLLWQPGPQEFWVLFVAAAMVGVIVGITFSQLRAFYGVLFKKDEEAAFSCFQVWNGLGFVLSFALSNHFCTAHKIYGIEVLGILGYIGYLVVEKERPKNE